MRPPNRELLWVGGSRPGRELDKYPGCEHDVRRQRLLPLNDMLGMAFLHGGVEALLAVVVTLR